MAITRPRTKSSKEADDFISRAPDSGKAAPAKKVVKGVQKGSKRQITLTISPALLERVDGLAEELGQSRAAVINMAIYRAVEHGLIKE